MPAARSAIASSSVATQTPSAPAARNARASDLQAVTVAVRLDHRPHRRPRGPTRARMAARLPTSAATSISSHIGRVSGGRPAARSRSSMVNAARSRCAGRRPTDGAGARAGRVASRAAGRRPGARHRPAAPGRARPRYRGGGRRGRPPPRSARPAPASDPMMPASTSPVPPVPRAGLANVLLATRPSGAATTVRAPLSTTTTPQRMAAALARSTRCSASGPTGAPSSRANSPGMRRQHAQPDTPLPPLLGAPRAR